MKEQKDEACQPFEVFHQSDATTCGIASLLMLRRDTTEIPFDLRGAHHALYMESYELYPEYYPLKVAAAHVRHFPDTRLTLHVDTKIQYKLIQFYNQEKQIMVVHQPLSDCWIVKQVQGGTPLAVWGDYHGLGYPEHAGHFLIVVNDPKDGLVMLDPSYYGKQPLDPEKLTHFLNMFKYNMQASPIAISMTIHTE